MNYNFIENDKNRKTAQKRVLFSEKDVYCHVPDPDWRLRQ
jgi:hypothetical protein